MFPMLNRNMRNTDFHLRPCRLGFRFGICAAVAVAAFSLESCHKKQEPSAPAVDPKEAARRDSLAAFYAKRNREWATDDSLYMVQRMARLEEEEANREKEKEAGKNSESESRAVSTPYSEGYAEGDDAGYEDGYKKRYKKHYDSSSSYRGAKASDYAEGYAEGYEEGYRRGKNRGEFDRGFDSGVYGENVHGYDRDNYDPAMDDMDDDF